MQTNQPTLTCSQESADSVSPSSRLDSEQSDSRKSTAMQAQSCAGIGQASQTMETCGTSQRDSISFLMSLQEAFRVSLSRLPGNGVEKATSGSYGRSVFASCASYDPNSHSLRTFQESLPLTVGEPSAECLVTFARSGLIASGTVYQLAPLVLITRGTGSGFVPTIVKNEGKGASKKRFAGSPDFRGAKMAEGLRRCSQDPPYTHPHFAAEAMGYPKNWAAMETQSSRKSQKSSRDQSTKQSQKQRVKFKFEPIEIKSGAKIEIPENPVHQIL